MHIIRRAPERITNIRSGFMVQDGTSNRNADVDGSSTSVEMVFGPGLTESWVIDQMLVFIYSSANVSETAYGALATLTNGIDADLYNADGLLVSLTGTAPVKSNNDLLTFGFDVRQNLFDVNPRSVSAIFNFGDGAGILLDGSKEERMIVRINDDLTGLISHFIRIEAEKVIQ